MQTTAGRGVLELLADLGLQEYAPVFEEEELTDVALLRSMRPDLLLSSLEELGLSAAHAAQLHAVVFTPTAAPSSSEGADPRSDVPPGPGGCEPPAVASEADYRDARARSRREAAELGRRLAQEAKEAAERQAAREAEEARARAEQSAREQLEARRSRAERLASQIESKMCKAPEAAAEGEARSPPAVRASPPSAEKPSTAARAARLSSRPPAEEAAEVRAQHVRKLGEERRRKQQEKELLLAEMKADRQHRAARRLCPAAPPAAAAGSPASGEVAAGGEAWGARLASVHSKLVAAGMEPNEAAALALRQVTCGCPANTPRRHACRLATAHGLAECAQLCEGEGEACGGPEEEEEEEEEEGATPRPPFEKLPLTTDPAERAKRLRIRLPSGEAIETRCSRRATVAELLEWLAGLTQQTVEDMVEANALLDRTVFPPVEVEDDERTVAEMGWAGGAMLGLQPRGAAPVKGGAARRTRKHVPKPKQVPTTQLQVPGGRIRGTLCGQYTFADGSFDKAGMLVLAVEPTPAGDALMASLQRELHFMTFAFRLPEKASDGVTKASLPVWRDDIQFTLQWLQSQHPALHLRGLIGHGVAADACLQYAIEYGSVASNPCRALVQLAGSAASRGTVPFSWRLLSVHGTNDESSLQAAELFHTRHKSQGHKLRLLDGAPRSFSGHIKTVATTINDWFEGARRLTNDDLSQWERSAAQAQQELMAAASSQATVEEDDLHMF